MEKTICVFGDSTAWGAWDTEKGGWVNRLWIAIAEGYQKGTGAYVEIYNLSISGGTSKTILERFENEARIRKATTLIFQTGGNDAAYEHAPENTWISLEEFRANLEEIIRRAQEITSEIFFIGFDPVDESKSMPVAWQELYYSNKNIQRYNEIMKTTCADKGVIYIDIWNQMSPTDMSDGVHPTPSGHEKIFRLVQAALQSKGIIAL